MPGLKDTHRIEQVIFVVQVQDATQINHSSDTHYIWYSSTTVCYQAVHARHLNSVRG